MSDLATCPMPALPEDLVEELVALRERVREDAGAAQPRLLAREAELLEGQHAEHPELLRRLALCHFEGEGLDRASELVRRAVERGAGEPHLEAHARQLFGAILWRQRDFLGALAECEAARSLLDEAERGGGPVDHELRGLLADLEGLILKNQGRLAEAIVLLEQGAEHWQAHGAVLQSARNALNRASTHEHLGDLTRALEVGLEAREGLEEFGDLRAQSILAFNLAVVHGRLREYDAARREAGIARDLAGDGAAPGIALAVRVLTCQLCVEQGDHETGRREGIALAELPDETWPILSRVNHQAAVAEALRECGELDLADRLVARALRDDGREQNDRALLEARLTRARIDLDLGRPAPEPLDLEALNREVERLAGPEQRADHQAWLARLAEASGDLAGALAAERRRVELVQANARERANQHVASLKAMHGIAQERAVRRTIERARDELEQRVEQRTAELSLAKEQLEAQIRERLEVEAERRELEAHLRRTERLEALGRLAGGVAHDFNNLLTVVSGSARLLGDRADAEPAWQDLVDEVLGACDHGVQLTRRLLAFGGRIELDPKALPAELVLDGSRFLLDRLLSDEIDLVFRPEAAGVHVLVDPSQLDSVLLNLALNARDAMPEGGRMTLSTELVDRAGTDWLAIQIEDTGHGIDPDHHDLVFEPFFTTKPAESGTGLGLSSALGVVRGLGGELELERSSSTGTAFRILLPLAESRVEEGTGEVAEPATPHATGRLAGRRLLLVEDDPAVRGLLAALLRHLGATTFEAQDGQEAFELLATGAGPAPDAVVCDVDMPRCGGPELVRRLGDHGIRLPVLLVSGWHGHRALPVDARELAGVPVDFLQKPVSLEVLERHLVELLERVGA